MNKKTYREKTKKRNLVSRRNKHPLSESVMKLAAENAPYILELFDSVKLGVQEELAIISAYEKEMKSGKSKPRSLFARFLSLPVNTPPKPELGQTVWKSYDYVDKIIDEIGIDGLACRKGCSWCCAQKVALSIPEAFYIAYYLEGSMASDVLKKLKEKISNTARQVAGMTEKDRKISRIFCPLLVDGNCSIYRARPITCRGYNSISEAICETNHFSRVDTTPKYNFLMKEYVYTVFYGIVEAAKEANLQSNAVELITALNFIFQNPDAESRWLCGESVFPPEVFALESYQPV